MELKYSTSNATIAKVDGFNRTFMELKFRTISYELGRSFVLIVPLWN